MNELIIKDKITTYVLQGRTKEAIKYALKYIINEKIRKELVLLSNRLKTIQKKEREGVISTESIRIEINSINSSLLELVGELNYQQENKNNKTKNEYSSIFSASVSAMIILSSIIIFLLVNRQESSSKDASRALLPNNKDTVINSVKVTRNNMVNTELNQVNKKEEHKTKKESDTRTPNAKLELFSLRIVINSEFTNSEIYVNNKKTTPIKDNLLIKEIELPELGREYEIKLVNEKGKICKKTIKFLKQNQKTILCG